MDTDQMKDDTFKAWMKESTVSPSDGFTNALMHNIVARKEMAPGRNRSIYLACAACFLLFVLSFAVPIPTITYLEYSFQPPSFLLPVLSVIFITYELGQMREISKISQTTIQ